MTLNVYCDGGSRGNPGPAACAFVVAGDMQYKCGKYLGETTNNVAEYQGVIEALSYLRNLGDLRDLSELNFFLDSNLVVNQLNGLFKVKNGTLRELLLKTRALEQEMNGVKLRYQYVPREQNWEADRLVNETLDAVQ